jgi:hypothetical protein
MGVNLMNKGAAFSTLLFNKNTPLLSGKNAPLRADLRRITA